MNVFNDRLLLLTSIKYCIGLRQHQQVHTQLLFSIPVYKSLQNNININLHQNAVSKKTKKRKKTVAQNQHKEKIQKFKIITYKKYFIS